MLKARFTKVTSRRVKYFTFLIGGIYGSSVDFQWADGRHNISLELRVKTKNLCYPEEMFLTL